MKGMIRKIVQVQGLDVHDQTSQHPEYWLSGATAESPAPADAMGGPPGAIRHDFELLLALLNGQKVEYLVVGGCALVFHGVPRATDDLDLFVRRTRENARRIVAALEDDGFASLTLSEADFMLPGNVVRLGAPPVCSDLITSLTALSWNQADAGKVAGRYGRTRAFFLGRDDLVLNKKALYRAGDAADIEALEAL